LSSFAFGSPGLSNAGTMSKTMLQCFFLTVAYGMAYLSLPSNTALSMTMSLTWPTAALKTAMLSPEPSTMTISFPPVQNKAEAQIRPTAGNAMTQWSGSGSGATGGDDSQWSGSGGDASQWTGTGDTGAGAWEGDPSHFASMFTLDLEAIRVAHAVLASVCMLIFFPFGGIILRLVPPEEHPHSVWFHAGVQIFAYTVFLAAAGLGIWQAVNYRVVSTHPSSASICLMLGPLSRRQGLTSL
jgi:hypothetical protein